MFSCSSIWLVGDSLSRGIMFDDARGRLAIGQGSFFSLLRDRLCPNVENISKLGLTVLPGAAALESRLHTARPDLVAIEFGGNDCDYDWDAIAKDPYALHQPKTPPEVFEKTLSDMVLLLRREGIIPVLFNLPPIDAERYFARITRGDPARAERILAWLGNVTHIYWWHERYSAIVEHVAEKTGTHLVELRRAFLFTNHIDAFIGNDGIHPNREGHKLIATTVLDAIRKHCAWILSPEERAI